MAADKQRRAFISYSRTNKEFASKLTKGLRSAGYPVWFDLMDIPTGSRWDDEVERALRECSVFMIILTPASTASENVKDEVGYAIDHGKRILPILLEDCDIPLRLRRFQYVDFTIKSFEEGFESARELLRDLIDEASLPVPTKTSTVENQMTQKAKYERYAPVKSATERKGMREPDLGRKKPLSRGLVIGIFSVVAVAVLIIAGIGFGSLFKKGSNNTSVANPSAEALVIANPATETPVVAEPVTERSNQLSPTPMLNTFDAGYEGGYIIQGQVNYEDALDNGGILVKLLVYDPKTYGAPLDSAIGSSITDENGNFQFIKVNPSHKYAVFAEAQRKGYAKAVTAWVDAVTSTTSSITVPEMVLSSPREVSFNWVYQPTETSDFRQGNTISGNSTVITPDPSSNLSTICFDSSIATECWKNFYVSFDHNETCLYANNSQNGGIYDAGEININEVTVVQENSVFEEQCTLAIVGHTYVIKLSDGKHYAKVQITNIQKVIP